MAKMTANFIKLKFLKSGDYPGLSKCVLNVITMPLQRKEGRFDYREDDKTEAERDLKMFFCLL